MARRIPMLAFPILLVCLATPAARAEVKQIMLARLQAQTRISAPAPAVWREITDGRKLARWMPEWNQPSNKRVQVITMGTVLDFVDEWNNRGRSVVTFVGSSESRDSHEIRFANEPTHGQFMCRTRITTTRIPQGTLVVLTEEYTDESAPGDVKATAQKMQTSLEQSLAALRKAVGNPRSERL
jgi:uncharacterized protein YndB with AHSA1/START domain